MGDLNRVGFEEKIRGGGRGNGGGGRGGEGGDGGRSRGGDGGRGGEGDRQYRSNDDRIWKNFMTRQRVRGGRG